ncbi:MAG: hypothetical protein ACKO4U_19765, partial [Caldilinea sp.]
MSHLISIITARHSELRNRSLDLFCRSATLEELLGECVALDRFRRQSDNLYERVRALFFLYAIHRFILPAHFPVAAAHHVPYEGYTHLLNRRFE